MLELFTSQGCSSCPPADAIVADLARTRPDVLPFTFHVTYWNRLGWHDPFSFEAATERQKHYVDVAVSPDVYTPALVVDGRRDVVGSQRDDVEASIARAVAGARVSASVDLHREGASLTIGIGEGAGQGRIFLIGFDSEHRTHVGWGENGGRTLLEANVVRSLESIGEWKGRALRIRHAHPVGEQAAVIVQADDGEVFGSARLLQATP